MTGAGGKFPEKKRQSQSYSHFQPLPLPYLAEQLGAAVHHHQAEKSSFQEFVGDNFLEKKQSHFLQTSPASPTLILQHPAPKYIFKKKHL